MKCHRGDRPQHNHNLLRCESCYMEKIRVRRFVPADQHAVRELVEQGLGEHFGFIDRSKNPDLKDIQRHYYEQGDLFFIAECEGTIVGTVGLLLTSEHPPRIVRMSVDRQHRRRGIARRLLQPCIESARARGASELLAFTQPEWPDAMGFYGANGFVVIGSDQEDVHFRLCIEPDSNGRNRS